MLLLKMRSRSVAHRLKSFQSSSGAPSKRQMIGIGYGSHTSATNSVLPASANGSTSRLITSRM